MKKTNIITETYECKKGFYVDVVYDGITYEAWIYHKAYGQKMLMFGITAQNGKSIIMEMIKSTIDNSINSYINNVF